MCCFFGKWARLAPGGWVTVTAALLGGCAMVGPDYKQPVVDIAPDWYEREFAAPIVTADDSKRWWERLNDPELNRLIEIALQANNSLEVAGLRVLESRAQLGIATGAQYPQVQVVAGGATGVRASKNAANTVAGDLRFTQYDAGVTASWELDFWGRFKRGIEAADAAYLGSVAAYDQAVILVTAQVASTYLAIRTLEAQLAITADNIASQQRSYDIVDVQFQNGNTSELDVLQARTQLLSTQAVVPALQADLRQARHALSTLLGKAPGSLREVLTEGGNIPRVPESLALGLPADVLRQRPDVRQAEYLAMAQNANVGLASADLYPSFSIGGSLGLVAAGNTNTTQTGKSGLDQLFSSDSLNYAIGPSFVWTFLNYGRIKNNIRVQDARLQQALVAYREAVIQAAREVEDALVALDGARARDELLAETVSVAGRANDVALLRFREGFADYQRVLDAQQALFAQQGNYVANKSNIVSGFIALYVSLGGGLQLSDGADPVSPVSEESLNAMRDRTDWGDLLDSPEELQENEP